MGESKQTQTSTRDPYAPAQPYITDILGTAQNLYNSGAGTAQWSGPTLSALDPRTIDAMNMTEANARGANTSLPFQYGNATIASGGITPQMQPALGVLGGIAGGGNAINTGGSYSDVASRASSSAVPGLLGDLYTNTTGQNARSLGVLDNPGTITTGGDYRSVLSSSGSPTASQSYLTDLAKGGADNPYLKDMLDANAARIANRVNTSISAQGRTGSFDHADALARSIAEGNNPIIAQAYEADQNRRLSAAGQIDASQRAADATRLAAIGGETGVQGQNIGTGLDAATRAAGLRQSDTSLGAGLLGQSAGITNANLGTELSALGGQTGVQGTNIGNAAGAATGLLGAYGQGQDRATQAAGMLPNFYSFQNAPAQDLDNIGQYMQGRSQAELDAERQAFQEANLMPWTQLGRYSSGGLGAVAPYAANAGTTTGTTTQETDPLRTIAGLGIAGAGLLMGNPMPAMGAASSMVGASGFGTGGFNPNVPGGWDSTFGRVPPNYLSFLGR